MKFHSTPSSKEAGGSTDSPVTLTRPSRVGGELSLYPNLAAMGRER